MRTAANAVYFHGIQPSRVGEKRRRTAGRTGRGEERSAPAGGSLSANASPPSRTHSWLSINIVVDSTLARSFIELSFRSNGQIAWVDSLSLSLSFSPLLSFSHPLPFSHGVCLFYEREHRRGSTFGAHFLLYIIGLRGEIARRVSSPSYRDRAAARVHVAEDRRNGQALALFSVLQEGHELRELLQLLLRQAEHVRWSVLFLVDLFARLHYGTVHGPAPVDGGLSRLVQRHSTHRCHGRQVQGGVRLRYQPHHPFSNIVCKNRGRNRRRDSVSAAEFLSPLIKNEKLE